VAAEERYTPAADGGSVDLSEATTTADRPTVAMALNASDDGHLDVSIVLPCFNEQAHVLLEVERIARTMDRSEFSYELVIIDDGSTDRTAEILRGALSRFPHARLVSFLRNAGPGTARRIGTQDARGRIVVWTDADMTYPNEDIPQFVRFLQASPNVDQVVGARTSEKGRHRWARTPTKWVIRKLASWLTSTDIPDLNSGFRAFRREVALPYLTLLPAGFSCVTTLTVAFLSNQHGVAYLPIPYARRSGTSKFRPVHDAYQYLLQVLRMVMYFNPLRVLMPVALWLLGVGIVKAIYDLVAHPFRIATNTILLVLCGIILASLALLADLIVRSRMT
jgi:glycosyltransferase involved in cell wall biosynthesis